MIIFLVSITTGILVFMAFFIGFKIGVASKVDPFRKVKIEYANGDDKNEFAEELKIIQKSSILRKDVKYHAQDDASEYEEELSKKELNL